MIIKDVIEEEEEGLKIHPMTNEVKQAPWLVPVTEVFKASTDSEQFSQIFALCFNINDCILQTFDIEMPEAAVTAKPRRSGGRKKKKSGTVSANIPGKVVTVEVEVGQEVIEGQVILILEAMKMQNEIQAPVSGTVVSVHCDEGEAIEANVPLVVIEPVASDNED